MNKNKNNKFTAYTPLLAIILLALFLSACLDTGITDDGLSGNNFSFNNNGTFDSEGGSSGTGNLDTGGGSSGTGVTTISQGVVTGFGSIFMNGIKFDTGTAIITIDGLAASENDLRVGMVGRITGEADLTTSTGVASHIDILFNVKGPIDNINLAENSIIVAGQTVIINTLTVFENGTLETLKPGDSVEVSGLSDMSGGPVYAGYIRVHATTLEQIEITGAINTLDTANQTFKIGIQLVNYSSTEFTGLTAAELINTMPVRIIGTRNTQSTIVVTGITNLSETPLGDENDVLIVEGIAESTIRLQASRQSFDISGVTVFITTDNTSTNTQFINGTPADIGYDTRLKVVGQFTAPGQLSADRIEFYIPPNVTAVGNIESIDVVANQVSIAGLSMQINNSTRMLDASRLALQKFSINDLSPGDQITAYILKTDSSITALFLRRDAIVGESTIETGSITLRGFANTPGASSFKLGTIDIDTSTTSIFFDPIRGLINTNDFFAAINGDSIVEARGQWKDSTLIASSIKFINLGNLTVISTSDGSAIAGSNDFFTVWDGTLNSEEDITNGTSRENMFISNRQLILSSEWRVHDIRVFGPGTYSFDSCPNNLDPCNIEMIVGENQIGAHMLIDWQNEVNIDVVNVWNRNQPFCPELNTPCSVYGLNTNPGWNLASADANADGISGITLEDSSFAYQLTVNFNLNF